MNYGRVSDVRTSPCPPTYAGSMWFLIIVALVVAGVVAWRMRVPLMAKILGQSESRMDRQLNRRKH